jgi:competence protein ComEC
MLLGEKSDLSEEQLVRFSQSGTMHLFAISGLHIGVISAVLAQALTLIRIPRRIAPFIGLFLLYVYVEITGAAPSAVRALIMVAFFWISFALNRQRSPFGALVASAFLVLVIDPWQLWQTGFQLSYLVVASILLFGLPFYRLTWPIIRPFDDLPQSTLEPIRRTAIFGLDRLWMLFGVSFSAWLVSAPLSMSISGYVAPYAVIINLLLVNLAALTITTGVISISLTLASFTGLSLFFNHAAWITIHLMEWVVLISSKIPGASLAVSDFPKIYAHVTIIIFLVSIFAISETRRLNKRFLLLAPLIIFIGVSLGNLIS